MKYSLLILSITLTLAAAQEATTIPTIAPVPPTDATTAATTTKVPVKQKLCWKGNNWCGLAIPARQQRCKRFFGMWKCPAGAVVIVPPTVAPAATTTVATPIDASTTTTKVPKLCWRGNNWCGLNIPARQQRCKRFFGMWKCY